ncbi:MAG: Ig-like domain-containing protein [Oscillospiraceae bacterium]|nr:Ig-like domain-containing protein [Oscillospiraceae bacterium]
MSLLKCPKCGEMFSDSYKTCPFCEEDEAFANGGKKPVNPGRRVHRQKSPSILGPTLVLVLVLVAGVLIYTLIGSGKPGDDQPDPPKNPTEDVDPNTPTVTLSLDQTALELTAGGTGKLAATGAEGITWTSSNAGVATVAEDGTVTAVAAGTATISASAEGADPVTCTVTVKEAPKKDLVLRSIYQSEGTALEQFSMSVGAPAVPMTVDGTDSTVKWSTEDSSIATINSDGEVTAVKSGKTMVVAVVDGQTLKCEVLVD